MSIQNTLEEEMMATAHLDAAHRGDIVGAFGTVRQHDSAPRSTWMARLGIVTGVGHARLIIERFGRFWGAFSVGDLSFINFLTIVTEFIGVSLALSYMGIS